MWVMQHDEEAENIASNALEFAKNIFSSEFQRKYLKEELEK
jgi:hypothetical protein